jgi:hypothetical protein
LRDARVDEFGLPVFRITRVKSVGLMLTRKVFTFVSPLRGSTDVC